ncbi:MULTISPECIES: DUF4194 domain-containing protein [unclassified Vibrio]|uniref:DUF4194 domain-containing protein n=1 Tax=unclassified Vibrio TaxID=2614977 RepID=UPI000B8E3C7A|nr:MULTISPECIES: DUF4194 domain-containing protein [unclassified Vibrio]NAX17682.1 DUF4194 domain-containing protein [Vibrio sp. V22_P2S10T140]OXX40364.1 hypothetical protein B9J83_13585 [Vibrio sp. V07_P2A8T137]OXX51573.1 hypothetical protein B9J82_16320 [Vibrio sp. V10_P2A27P122]PSD42090.1 DUF4194 domain-containing protein [Vibrio sp. V02_P2A34T13]
MPTSWKRIAEQSKFANERDFQRAAQRLIFEQIIYQANPRQRADYDLIASYENEFSEALDLLGCRLDLNTQERYIAAIPIMSEISKVPLMHTLLALVLRKLYDHHMHRGMLNASIAGVSLAELEAAFKESTGRDLPMKPQSELQGMLDSMKRWGIARLIKSENLGDADWFVEILPGIQSLINEQTVLQLKINAEMLYEPSDYKKYGENLKEVSL